ncbi:YgiQ family radical SAM protein [Thermotoga sp. KOL6]|uniref:YgiQ family radical SAM protein n=1 Tax=Thermotoga sp. KOL6 TaxID=126741 RepID=UPI000C79063B|nr:YgiQ family radical SAM protein [Thermotoga sp. KOL6]PLV59076.1 YgiQ family radical SAM protein [Thermotoga sp. KOL6]
MFLPTTREEMESLGWKELDVILVTGDAYVDHPSFGVALIGQLLLSKGYKVGVIAQPDWRTEKDITRLGRPRLFFGVTSGNVDSMVANYTASKKRRKTDDYTPSGKFGKRPDRATIVYSNLIRHFFSGVPIVLGGIEASLRRFAHYDWWQDIVRKSVLVDSKADLLVYGMGERAILEIARILSETGDIEKCKRVPGVVWWTSKKPKNGIELPSYDEINEIPEKYAEALRLQTWYTDSYRNTILYQRQDTRYVVQNPPFPPLSQKDLDYLYLLPFEREVHPFYRKMGRVKSIETVKFSITAVRGCFGSCSFCAITQHQTTHVVSRSKGSILEEVKVLTKREDFKGVITDVGGPTANLYGSRCLVREAKGQCQKFCLYPHVCGGNKPNHNEFIDLLESIKKLPKVKNVFISSGIRHDFVLAEKDPNIFLKELVKYTPGQLKLAPEHAHPKVLSLMRKPPVELFLEFKRRFEHFARKQMKKKYVIGYFMVGHPGEGLKENNYLREFILKHLGYFPQQIQIFTPTPGTVSTAMYYSGIDPFTGERVHVERSLRVRNKMKENVLIKFKKRREKK